MDPVHAEPIDSLVRRLGVSAAHGLSQAEVSARQKTGGPNKLPEPEPPNRLRQFFAQFTNPIVLTLLGAAIIAVVDGFQRPGASVLERFGDATAIFLIVALNAVLGFYQELRAEAALEALKRMQTKTARVRRDGRVLVVPADELVVGDVLELEAGDATPADARLLQAVNLSVEEAALTGESVPSSKDALAVLAHDAPMGDRVTMLFVGTSIVRGKARAVVVAIGPETELGRLSELMNQAGDRRTPLEEKLEHFGKRVLWACLLLSALLFARGMLSGTRSWNAVLLEAVSLAVAAIPEGLPAITTITLALGMQRMAKHGAIVRKLAAVETLGAATVICTDKTGTLTENEMTVRELYAGGIAYRALGVGYAPRGEIVDHDGTPVVDPPAGLRDLLTTIALCNNAELEERADGTWRVIGDPTEGALLTLAAKGGLPRESFALSHKVIHELPFDSDRKRMTIVTLDDTARHIVHTKGSADVLLPLCSQVATAEGYVPLDDATRDTILREAERMSSDALRVLGVARRELPQNHDVPTGDGMGVEFENRLTFVGLVGMMDPPRQGVKEAVRACEEARVRAVMITGDHKLTAVAIAKELGIWKEHSLAFSGTELEKMTEGDLASAVEESAVFARVTAEQKLLIVRAFRKNGHVVAMTGDGVNDAPALREAHIGVAMGKSGTDVAREAADMVIADDNFATIVHAVREGRAIYRNIQKCIFFLLSSNMGLLVAVFVASFLNMKPLTPLMILWINLVTNGLPALALGVDAPDPSQMSEPPRRANEGLLGPREYWGIASVGLFMGACALFLQWSPIRGESDLMARALAFSLLALSPLFHAFNCRSPRVSAFRMKPFLSTPLVLAVSVSAAIHFAAVLIPSLRPLFQTYALSGEEWALLMSLSAAILLYVEFEKWLYRKGILAFDRTARVT